MTELVVNMYGRFDVTAGIPPVPEALPELHSRKCFHGAGSFHFHTAECRFGTGLVPATTSRPSFYPYTGAGYSLVSNQANGNWKLITNGTGRSCLSSTANGG